MKFRVRSGFLKKGYYIAAGAAAIVGIAVALLLFTGSSRKTVVDEIPKLSGPLKENLLNLVSGYRKIIVLLEDETRLSPQQKKNATEIGWKLFTDNTKLQESLAGSLIADIKEAEKNGFSSAPHIVAEFLTELEQSTDWHDADKLVFLETVFSLSDTLRDIPGSHKIKKDLQARINEDLQALLEIKALYNRELDKIFGRFETRGMVVRREKWEAYIAFLNTRINRDDLFREYKSVIAETITAEPARNQIGGRELPEKTLVLTFDDGPHQKYTDRILEILNKHKVKAVFFQVGNKLGSVSEGSEVRTSRLSAVTQRLLEAGNSIANHSFTHANLVKLEDKDREEEVSKTNRVINKVTNIETALFRPPYGAQNGKLLAALNAINMKSVLWNVDSRDWADPIPKSIANRVLREVSQQKRGIILFHDIHERTVEALPLILETLKNEGYTFLSWNGKAFTNESRGAAGAPASDSKPMYRESWAVIIGIDKYKNWTKLQYAVNDAKAMRDILIRKYRFKAENIYFLSNEEATRERIMSVMGDVLGNPEKVRKDDRVFVFFAGHGTTRKLPSGRDLGYIVPVEADLSNYQGQAISMTNFQDISEAIPAKHIFFVMDSCYSGLGLTRGAPKSEKYLREIARRNARQMLTAGGADEQVADNGPNGHSVFTWTLLQGLEGKADLNGDGVITASELAAYVGPSVSAISKQTPAFGSLPGSEGGEFIFDPKQDNEFLSELSTQLDTEAIQLNAQLDAVRKQLAEKSKRNTELRKELAAAQAKLEGAPAKGSSQLQFAKHMERGNATFREKNYQEALREFMAAAKLKPSSALAANNVGYLYYKMEQYTEAARWFEKTIAIDPRRTIAYANLGEAYHKLDRNDEAKKMMARYLESAPANRYTEDIRRKFKGL
jgi:peptidoglycan/xylan/chitin deacetylase (PgdA/CDA1 family)/uncharacterized caspase-like protein